MNVKLAVLADYAATTPDGKLIICGIFDRLQLPQLPFKYSRIYIAMRLTAHPSEPREQALIIKIVNPDGVPVLSDLRGKVKFPSPRRNEQRSLQVVLDLNGLEFKTAGGHSVDILINDRYEDSVPFTVELADQPGTK